MDVMPVIAVAVFGFVAFIVLWLFVVGLIAFLSGWRSTAKQYPDSPMKGPETASFSFQSVRFGFFGNYNFVINVILYAEGVMIKPIIFYAFMHRPIFLPWGAIQNAEKGKFIVPYITLTFGKKKIMITGKSASAIYDHVMTHR
jgi:hypothetical protein